MDTKLEVNMQQKVILLCGIKNGAKVLTAGGRCFLTQRGQEIC
jgi:hypothetical protein